jgi:hypothetical protein
MRRIFALGCALALAAITAAPVAAARPAPPANDDIANAVVIAALPYSASQDTKRATASPDDGGCGGEQDLATVWYTFTPTADTRILVDATASSYEVGVNIFESTADGRFVISCFQGPGTADLMAGTTYYLMFAACCTGENGGTLSFTITELPLLEIGLTVDPTGTVNPRTGVATVSGTVTCSSPTDVSIDGRLRQRVGRILISGFFFTSVACDGSAAWSATATGENGVFGPGEATVEAFAFACDEFGCADAQASATIRLAATRY